MKPYSFVTVCRGESSVAFAAAVLSLAKTVLRMERVVSNVHLSIRLVNPHQMRMIHWDSKGIDAPTDALTFHEERVTTDMVHSLLFGGLTSEVDAKLCQAQKEELQEAQRDLGEIYLCPQYMRWRCQRYPHRCLPMQQYLLASIVHAVLHSVGYDHETPAMLSEMIRKEQHLGYRMRLKRDNAEWQCLWRHLVLHQHNR